MEQAIKDESEAIAKIGIVANDGNDTSDDEDESPISRRKASSRFFKLLDAEVERQKR